MILRLQSLYVLEGEGSEYCVADQETSHPHLQTCRLVNRRQYLNSNFDLRGILLNYYICSIFGDLWFKFDVYFYAIRASCHLCVKCKCKQRIPSCEFRIVIVKWTLSEFIQPGRWFDLQQEGHNRRGGNSRLSIGGQIRPQCCAGLQVRFARRFAYPACSRKSFEVVYSMLLLH